MKVRRLDPVKGFVDAIRDIEDKANSHDTRTSGTVVIRQSLVTIDPITGNKAIFGRLPDGSFGFEDFIGDTVPPGKPSTPTTEGAIGAVNVFWDGKESGGTLQPKDYAKTVVEYSTNGTVWSVGGTMYDEGSTLVPGLAIGTEHSFRLISFDKSGNASTPSDVVKGTPVAAADNPDLDKALSDLRAKDASLTTAASTATEKAQKALDDLLLANNAIDAVEGRVDSTEQNITAATAAAAKAQQDALAAAGLAGSKGKVWFQNDAPVSGTSFAWVGTAANSQSIQRSDGVEKRRNLCVDPQATVLNRSWNQGRWAGGGTALASHTITTGPTPVGNTFLRKQWTQAGGGTGDTGFNMQGTYPITAGRVVHMITHMRSSIAKNFYLRAQFKDSAGVTLGGNASFTFNSPSFVSRPGVWEKLEYTFPAAPANSATVSFISETNGLANWAVGDTLDGTGLLLEYDTTGAYFDGDGPDDRASDLWVDTNDGNKPYRWNSVTNTWDLSTDQRITDAATAAKTANDNLTLLSNRVTTTETNITTATAAAAAAQRAADAAARSAVSVILNGSLENDFTDWEPTTLIIDSAVARTGTKSLKTTGSGETRQKGFPVTVGDTWRYDAYAKSDAPVNTALNGGLRLQKSSDNGVTWSDAASANPTASSDWKIQRAEYVVATGVTHLRARVAFSYPGGYSTWFDDFSLTNVTELKVLEAAAKKAADDAKTANDLAKTKVRTFTGTTAPTGLTNDNIGDLWIDGNGRVNRWQLDAGVAKWMLVSDNGTTAANNALSTMGLSKNWVDTIAAQSDKAITTFYGTATPTGMAEGDLWLSGTAGSPMKRYTGGAWVDFEDPEVIAAYDRAGDALSLADQKVRTFAQNSAPTGLVAADEGDLWINTTAGSGATSRWSGTAWVLVSNVAGDLTPLINAKGKVIIQPAEPAIADRLAQNLWIDTTSIGTPPAPGNIPKRWNGTTSRWEAVTEKAVVDAAAAAVAAQGDATKALSDAGLAMTAASARSRIVHLNTTPPVPTGGWNEEDVWYKHATIDIASPVVEWYRWKVVSGTGSWVKQVMDETFIPSLNIGTGTYGSLRGTRLEAKTVTTDRLVITSSDNVIEEPDFTAAGIGWTRNANILHSVGTGLGGGNSLRFTGSMTALLSPNLGPRIPVDPDGSFRGVIRVKSTSPLVVNSVRLVMRCYTTTAGAYTDVTIASNTTALVANTFATFDVAIGKVVANTINVGFYIFVTNPTTGTITDVDYVSAVRAASGSLIVDGALTGKTITGALIQSRTDTYRGLKLNDGQFVAYDATNTAAGETFRIDGTTGAVTMKGSLTSGSTITGTTMTGGLVQTLVAANRGIKLDSATNTFKVWDAAGVQTFGLDGATGSVALKGSLLAGSDIVGAGISGSTMTGGVVQTLADANRGIKLNGTDNTLRMWDGTGIQTFLMDGATGRFSAVGNVSTLATSGAGIDLKAGQSTVIDSAGARIGNSVVSLFTGDTQETGPSEILAYATASGYPGMLLAGPSKNNSAATHRARVYLGHHPLGPELTLFAGRIKFNATNFDGTKGSVEVINGDMSVGGDVNLAGNFSGVYNYNGLLRLHGHGGADPNGTGAVLNDRWGGSYVSVGNDSGGSYVEMPAADARTTTRASNMNIYINKLYRTTSASKYKLAIERGMDYTDRILSLQAATWFDKSESEAVADWKSREEGVETEDKKNSPLAPVGVLRRVPGMVAEDVEAAGLSEFVIYNEDGEIEGLMYERLAVALIPTVAKLRDRIEALEKGLK